MFEPFADSLIQSDVNESDDCGKHAPHGRMNSLAVFLRLSPRLGSHFNFLHLLYYIFAFGVGLIA